MTKTATGRPSGPGVLSRHHRLLPSYLEMVHRPALWSRPGVVWSSVERSGVLRVWSNLEHCWALPSLLCTDPMVPIWAPTLMELSGSAYYWSTDHSSLPEQSHLFRAKAFKGIKASSIAHLSYFGLRWGVSGQRGLESPKISKLGIEMQSKKKKIGCLLQAMTSTERKVCACSTVLPWCSPGYQQCLHWGWV